MPPRFLLRAKPSAKSNAVRITPTAKTLDQSYPRPTKLAAVQRQTTAEASQNIISWHANPFEREFPQEVRAITHRIDRRARRRRGLMLGPSQAMHDRGIPLLSGRSIWIVVRAEYRTLEGRAPLRSQPVAGEETWLCGQPWMKSICPLENFASVVRTPSRPAGGDATLRTAPRFGGAKRASGARLFQECGQLPTPLLLRAADQERQ